MREYDAMRKLALSGRVFEAEHYFGEKDDQIWVVPMHLPSPGLRTLRERIVAGERPSVDAFIKVAANAFEGLADIHAQEIVHRALHPSRILVPDTLDAVTFADFLLAKFTDTDVTITDIDDVDDLGHPFRAPECCGSWHAATDRSDVYSLALCLLAWLKVDKADPDAKPVVPVTLPDRVRTVIESSLATKPKDRPDARKAADLLADYLRDVRKRETRPTAGLKIANKYELLEELGTGATATTWLVIDRRMGIRHTLKIMHSGDMQSRLEAEFKHLHRLKHPRIMRANDYLLEPPFSPALVAEFVEGETVRKLAPALRGNGSECLQILRDILDGLDHAHQKKILHRDVSPNNIIVDADTRATLIDFGVASDGADHSVVGTLPYQAPEIAAGRSWSEAADLYSLAVVCFEALTGRYPYEDNGRFQDKNTLVRPSDDELSAAGGRALLEVLLHAADPNPENRFPSASAFRDALPHSLVGEPDEASLEEQRSLLVNPNVDEIRKLFRNSRLGNSGNRGLDTEFAKQTYIETRLDERLVPRIVNGRPRLVVFSGNPGDGKTAFLERLHTVLVGQGATETARDKAGWLLALDGHEFASVYDASESHGTMSADDLLRRALDPLTDPTRTTRYTALIAANDGRLLDFLDREQHRYPEIADELLRTDRDPDAAGKTGIHRIDLKSRSMASTGAAAGSLTVRILDALVTEQLWSTCSGCLAEPRCPIIRNASQLRKDQVQDRLHRLVLTSHLRRGRRPTIRDLRSALAYLVTNDLGCADIGREYQDGGLGLSAHDRHFSSAAFEATAGRDRLLDEWQKLDPGAVAAPRVERLLAPEARTASEMKRAKRRHYFTTPDEELAAAGHLSPYRHLDTFRAILSGGPTDQVHVPLLRGLSRCIGPVGYCGTGVAVSIGEPADDGGGAVVKVLPEEEFEIAVRQPDDLYVEATADVFGLRHRAGQAMMTVDIDLFELLMRAAAGYLPTNPEVTPLLEELGLFRSRLTLERAQKVIVIEPNGRRNTIRVAGTTLELLGAER